MIPNNYKHLTPLSLTKRKYNNTQLVERTRTPMNKTFTDFVNKYQKVSSNVIETYVAKQLKEDDKKAKK